MARERPLYRYDDDRKEWVETNETINVDEYLFRDVSSTDNIDLSQYEYAKVDGHLCRIDSLPETFIENNITALLMPANYAYQENGETLFSNVDKGKEITGVVGLVEIEDEKALENAKKPGMTNPVPIGASDQTWATQYDVGGFLCIKDKKNYQFSGLKFDDHSERVGHFGLKNPNQQNVIKGFGFIDRKPIVLWENFYNFKKTKEMPKYEIKNGWLYENDIQKIHVRDAHLVVYKKTSKIDVHSAEEVNKGRVNGFRVETFSANQHDQNCVVHLNYTTDYNKSKGEYFDDYGYSSVINVTSSIEYTKTKNTTDSKNIYTEYENSIEKKTTKTIAFNTDIFGTGSSTWWTDSHFYFYETSTKIPKSISNFENAFAGPSFSTFECCAHKNMSSGYTQNLASVDPRFTTFVINFKTLPFLHHVDLQLELKDFNYKYACYNEELLWNNTTLYCELSAIVSTNYDCGLYDQISLDHGWSSTQGYNTTTKLSNNDSEEEASFVINEDLDTATIPVGRGVFYDFSPEKRSSLGLFFGVRCQQNTEIYSYEDVINNKQNPLEWGDRYCITLEWDD